MSYRPADADIERLTRSDLESLAGKLQAWGASLPPREQAVLTLLLAQSQNAGEVQGYLHNLAGGSFQSTTFARLTPTFTMGIGPSGLGGSHGYEVKPWMESIPPQPNRY